MRCILLFAAALSLFPLSSALAAQGPAKPLLDPAAAGIEKQVKLTPQVSVAPTPDGLAVTIAPGKEGYPGITLTPADGAATWDLSAYGRLEARIRNTSDQPLGLTLRIDDDGNWNTNPWNAENATVPPGKTTTVRVIFGHSFGFKPAHKLASGRIARVLLFTGKTDTRRAFVIESIVAAGETGEKPPVDPASIRIVPPDGLIVGAGAEINVAKQVTIPDGATATPQPNGAIKLSFPKAGKDLYASIKPAVGRWNLRRWLAARVRLRNTGDVPLTPRLRLESGSRGDVITSAPIAPGAVAEIVIPFAAAHVWDGERKETHAARFASNAASAVTIGVAKGDGQRALLVEEVRAVLPPAQPLPDWLGKRPPVTDGQWVSTFDDEFDGNAVDTTKWSYYGENYWDHQTTHFAKANTIVSDGVARLRLLKQRGHHNDDPKRFQSDYATGFLETRGKWTQRYGYFETRLKLPTAPGLWPAFWMMPDRGPGAAGGGTNDGGMEFDIMEHLTRWGVNRYNIAMHWDGYGKNHKSIGTDVVYGQPDKDGFVTAGLLWLPGKAVYYCNGQEVARWENPRIASVPAEMMFTLPAGGWDNDSLDDAKLPDDLVIDYVRVWQRSDLK